MSRAPLFPILPLFVPFPLKLIHAVWPAPCQNRTKVSEPQRGCGLQAAPLRSRRRKGRLPPSPSFERNLPARDPGPLDLEEAGTDQAGLDRLLLHGRVNPDPEEARGLRLRLRDGLARALDVDPEGADADPEGLPCSQSELWYDGARHVEPTISGDSGESYGESGTC